MFRHRVRSQGQLVVPPNVHLFEVPTQRGPANTLTALLPIVSLPLICRLRHLSDFLKSQVPLSSDPYLSTHQPVTLSVCCNRQTQSDHHHPTGAPPANRVKLQQIGQCQDCREIPLEASSELYVPTGAIECHVCPGGIIRVSVAVFIDWSRPLVSDRQG